MDAAALILRRCKVSPIRAARALALAHHQVLQRVKVEIQSKATGIINAYAGKTIHHYGILCCMGKERIIYKRGHLECTRE